MEATGADGPGPLGMGHRGVADGYGEGERVFAPPQGTFDPAWVARLLVEADPALDPAEALDRVTRAWALLVAGTPPSRLHLGADLAGQGLGASEADAVARVVLAAAEAYDALPG